MIMSDFTFMNQYVANLDENLEKLRDEIAAINPTLADHYQSILTLCEAVKKCGEGIAALNEKNKTLNERVIALETRIANMEEINNIQMKIYEKG